MNINYLKHWLLELYTFTLWRTLFKRTKRLTMKWTTDHPPLPGNREEKALAGVILQQEVLVRNKELTSYHQPGFWRGQKRWETAVQRSYQLPRILLTGIHLGWVMHVPPGRIPIQNDWQETSQKLTQWPENLRLWATWQNSSLRFPHPPALRPSSPSQ